jgi:hypothetical protein
MTMGKIDVQSRNSVSQWAKALGISSAHLRALVEKVGNDAAVVRATLTGATSRSGLRARRQQLDTDQISKTAAKSCAARDAAGCGSR